MMSTENEQHKTQTLELDGQLLTEHDYELLIRMLPDSCCAKCKHWRLLDWPRWPDREVLFRTSTSDGDVSYLLTLYSRVDWNGECRRFPPLYAPADVRRSNRRYEWPFTWCRDCCGEFTPRD